MSRDLQPDLFSWRPAQKPSMDPVQTTVVEPTQNVGHGTASDPAVTSVHPAVRGHFETAVSHPFDPAVTSSDSSIRQCGVVEKAWPGRSRTPQRERRGLEAAGAAGADGALCETAGAALETGGEFRALRDPQEPGSKAPLEPGAQGAPEWPADDLRSNPGGVAGDAREAHAGEPPARHAADRDAGPHGDLSASRAPESSSPRPLAAQAPVDPGRPTLRPYQASAVAAVLAEWARGVRSTLLDLPTGGGKTICFAQIARHLVETTGKRVLVLAHRSELLEQAQRKLRDVGVTAAIEQADKRAGRGVDVVVASVQTLRGKRLHKFRPDEFAAVIVDEAHHANAASYRAILDWFEALVLGVSATPKRADGQALGDVFQSVAFRYPLQKAIADGYLVPISARRVFVESINLAGVRDRAKDLATDELAQAMATDEAVLGVVLPTLELVGDRRAIVFAVDVAHARALTVAICERKPGAARVAHGELSAEEREGLLVDFRRGRFQFLVNCALYTEGFDEPSVQAVVCARPTKSWALYTQMVGRGTRLLGATLAESIAAGKSDCLLVDVAGNSGRHKLVGPIDALAAGDVPDDVRREVERRLEDGETDLADAIAEATAEVERRRKEMRAGASALYLAREVDPFLGDALGEPCTESWAGDPATQQDRVDLLNMGVKRIPERITRGEATRILRAEAARRAKGLASFKQLQVLRRCVDEKLLAKLTKSQASRRIAILAEVGWVPAAAAPRMRALEATEMLEAAKRSEEAQR